MSKPMTDSDSAAQITPTPIFEAVGAVLKFEAAEAAASAASAVKTEVRFGLSRPGYLLGVVFEAVDGCFILIWVSKKLVVS